MKNYAQEFKLLTESLSQFIDEVQKLKLSLMVTEEWTVKDTLCHIVFWHEIYAGNYAAQVKKEHFQLPEQMSTINHRGVASLNNFSKKKLLEKLDVAHKSLYSSIVDHAIGSMIYSKGGRRYETAEFLSMIAGHIASHTKQVKRAGKRKFMN